MSTAKNSARADGSSRRTPASAEVRVRAPPGAGRPAKRYRRGDGELTVTIPPREYDLAGHIMAEAISEHASAATPIAEALAKAAASHGREIGAGCGRLDPTAEVLDRCLDLLVQHGYEPRQVGRTVLPHQLPVPQPCAESHAARLPDEPRAARRLRAIRRAGSSRGPPRTWRRSVLRDVEREPLTCQTLKVPIRRRLT